MMVRMAQPRWMMLAMGTGIATLVARDAAAQQTAMARDAIAARQLDKPYTQVEAGLGMLTLPATNVCLTAPNTCTRGDITPQGYAWMLYRTGGTYAVGAGVGYAPATRTDTPQRTYANLDRSHKRDYLTIDMVGRYYALRSSWLEGWLGMTVGGVVVYDRFETKTESPSAPILGPSGVVLRTEGVSMGIAGGLGWTFAPNWSVEAAVRSAWWFLPGTRQCAPTGDCATLANDVAMFNLGIGVGYRIAL